MVKKRWPWACFVLCYFGYMSLYICRNNLSIISPLLVEEGIATASQVGLLTGLFSIGYASGKVLFGSLGDRFDPKWIAGIGVAISGLSNLLIGLIPGGFLWMLLLWVFNSIGQSLVWGPSLRLMILNFPPERTPFVNSMLVTTTASGSIAGILIASAVAKVDAAPGFLIPGLIALLASLCLVLLFPGESRVKGSKGQKGGLIAALKHRSVRKMLLPAFAHGVIKDNVINWASLYLAARYLLDLSKLPVFILLIPLISFIGRLCYPLFFKLCGNDPQRVSVVCFFGCLLAAAPLALNVGSVWVAIVLLVLLSTFGNVMNTSFLTMFPITMEKYGLVSSTASLLDVVTYSALGISSAVFGAIIEGLGIKGYQVMFLIFILFAALGIIMLWKKAVKKNG